MVQEEKKKKKKKKNAPPDGELAFDVPWEGFFFGGNKLTSDIVLLPLALTTVR